MRWIEVHSSLPGEHNKECLLAERSDKHLFPLLVLEDNQVSVAVSCSFLSSPGWWHLALEVQMSVDAQHQGASYKEPLCCCGGFWLPKTPALCQGPHKYKIPAIPGGATRRWLVCLSGLLTALSPFSLPLSAGYEFHKTVQGLNWILFDFGPDQIGISSMAQQLEINTHNLSCKAVRL